MDILENKNLMKNWINYGKTPYEIADELKLSVNIIYNFLRTKNG